jgi:hypothetical protein
MKRLMKPKLENKTENKLDKLRRIEMKHEDKKLNDMM